MTTLARWGALLLLTLGLALPAGAHAIPDDGAGANTPGTASSVAPRTLRAGDTLTFQVSGFPAGETVYIKIDDGTSCSAAAVHGACVQHLQRISANGTVSGSFQLPGDLKPGKHWLRFLASAEVRDSSGGYQGIKGYTRRSPDFTVVAGSGSTGKDTSSDGSNSGSSNGSTDTATSTGTVPVTGSTDGAPQSAGQDQVLVAPRMSAPTQAAESDAATGSGDAAAQDAADPDAADAPAAAPVADSDHVPYLGAGALVLCLLAAAWLLLRGRRVALRG
ncbi:hypothetical protein NODU109028_13820 [Nocardioides dubius]|uniref:Uncharacterized protein n=1 Tax=Nocardioides dubius TaxID=317019 RepID=A0ABN1TKC1_9ACTN